MGGFDDDPFLLGWLGWQVRTVSFRECIIWGFPKIGVPQNGWFMFIMENPIKMDDLGGKPTIFGNPHLKQQHEIAVPCVVLEPGIAAAATLGCLRYVSPGFWRLPKIETGEIFSYPPEVWHSPWKVTFRKGKDRLPTIIFQGLCSTSGVYIHLLVEEDLFLLCEWQN